MWDWLQPFFNLLNDLATYIVNFLFYMLITLVNLVIAAIGALANTIVAMLPDSFASG